MTNEQKARAERVANMNNTLVAAGYAVSTFSQPTVTGAIRIDGVDRLGNSFAVMVH